MLLTPGVLGFTPPMVLDLEQGQNIQFWEVPETSQRDFLRQKLYAGAVIAVLVYDVTSRRCTRLAPRGPPPRTLPLTSERRGLRRQVLRKRHHRRLSGSPALGPVVQPDFFGRN